MRDSFAEANELGGPPRTEERILELVFETWRAVFTPLPYRVVDPPMPVTVRFGSGLVRTPQRLGPGGIPLRVRREGLCVDRDIPGLLHAWARLDTGEWLCLLSFRVPTGNRKGYLDMRQWCPAAAAVRRNT